MFDWILLGVLVLAVPARAIWRDLRGRKGGARPGRTARYLKTAALALVLLVVLAADWTVNGRSLGALGLELPPSTPGMIGLALAVVVLAGVTVALARGGSRQPQSAPVSDLALLPTTRAEFTAFVAFALVIGAAWEVLYRGFLLWDLEPRIGAPAAVAVAATAYGAAHGVKNPRKLVGSLVAAFVFTIAYVLTRSLWWLMAIHAALPVLAASFHLRRLEAAAAPAPAASTVEAA